MKSLAHHLLGQTRTAVLGALLLHPEDSLHVREIARLTGSHPGSLHRELRTLAELGLLLRQDVGHQVHYRANQQSPVFHELAGLLRKTAGVADLLRDALAPLLGRIELAFVYGSMASGEVHAHSDIDVMIIGNVGLAETVLALDGAQTALRREINPTLFSREEWEKRREQKDSFVTDVWKKPKLWLIGNKDEPG
jgi:predicted nucleotidyltransferase/DNA-binding HxlR family transcriptional regulator